MQDFEIEKKFVAFIDILGFKEIVNSIENKSKTCERDYEKILSILEFLNRQSKECDDFYCLPIYEKTDEGMIWTDLGNPIITYASDCIIISTDGTFDGFKAMCNKISRFIVETAAEGVFLRGAVTYGKIYHDDRIFFGSAYQEAYKIESTEAKYPRIVIDDTVLDYLKDYDGTFPLNERTVFTDEDGRRYLNPFQWNIYSRHCINWYGFMMMVKRHLLYQLNQFDSRVFECSKELKEIIPYYIWKDLYCRELDFSKHNDKILSKYIWLADKFNKTIEDEIYKYYFFDNKTEKRILHKIVFKNNHWGPEEVLGYPALRGNLKFL